jgi:putative membrane protein
VSSEQVNKNEPNPERYPDRFEVHLTASDHLAWLRTRLSVESTLMAWLRTAVTLIGFGFTIVQVLERLQSQVAGKPVLLPDAPRNLGLALIGSGVFGIVIALWQYRLLTTYLWSGKFLGIAGISDKPYWTPLFAVSILIAFVGVAAFVTVLFRLS